MWRGLRGQDYGCCRLRCDGRFFPLRSTDDACTFAALDAVIFA